MKTTEWLFGVALLLTGSILASPCVLAQGKGSYVAGINYPAGPPTIPTNTGFWLGGISPVEIHTGDVNGDGKPDVVVAASCAYSSFPDCPLNASLVAVYLSNGDGTFQAPIVNSGSLPPELRSMTLGDFNGDGKLDVAVAADCLSGQDCSAGTVTVLLGNGDGTFTQSSQYPLNGIVGTATTIAAADFNKDGESDLAVGVECYNIPVNGCAVGAVEIFLSSGGGTLASPVAYSTVGNNPILPIIGDFNGDGKSDVIVGLTGPSSGLMVLIGKGDGSFSQPSNDQITLPIANLIALTAGDLNSDGKLDLVLTSETGPIDVAFGNGDGSFQSPTSISTELPTSMRVKSSTSTAMDILTLSFPALKVLPGKD